MMSKIWTNGDTIIWLSSCQKYEQMGMQLSDWVENIVGKGEIARYEQFLLFLQCFQKLSVVDASTERVSMELRVKYDTVTNREVW